ncbi:hypothetical protein GCM10010361_25870 [Streptomyces olivaceiscleroticus]|uniref:Uncharacterized protein n=1 Tax=Streptomyces olivaceiscleroticus TaxID=68245 RepID=A0ABP3JT35_9ACTN
MYGKVSFLHSEGWRAQVHTRLDEGGCCTDGIDSSATFGRACAARDARTLGRTFRPLLTLSALLIAWKRRDGNVSRHAAAQGSSKAFVTGTSRVRGRTTGDAATGKSPPPVAPKVLSASAAHRRPGCRESRSDPALAPGRSGDPGATPAHNC